MHNMHESEGAVVDRRLEPAGLTHMLGPYGQARRRVLGFSLLLLAGAGAALVAFPHLEMVFIVPIVLLAAEFGVRAGLLAAAASTGILLGWALTTAGAHEDLLGIVLRSLALLFLAWVVGRLSERAARSGRLQAESTRFFDLSGDMLCTVGFDGTMHRVNDEWERTLGWSSYELLGRSIFEYTAPEDHQAASDATRAARAANASGAQLTTRWRAKDGSWHWIDWSLRIVDDESRIYASGRDVTERRTAQRALARSESRYRALVHGLPGTAVLVFDHDLITEFAAGQALTGAGYDAETLVGCHVSTIFAKPSASRLEEACEAALAGEERSVDALLACEGSHELWVRLSALRGESGQIVGAMLIAQDVHDRIERERAFGEAQERFRRAFDDAPIGMAVIDVEGGFLEVNQALCAITGRPAEELCATTRMAITHPDDVAADVEAMRAMLAGTISCHVVEKRYIRPDGETVWVTVNVTVVRDPDGRALNFLAQVQDVTDRRRFESELRHLADHDPLTGLFNRRRFEQELERQVTEVSRYGPRGALLVLDLDHFKYVNDALGHHAGDADPVRRGAAAEPAARQRHRGEARRRRVRGAAADRDPGRGRARRRRAPARRA